MTSPVLAPQRERHRATRNDDDAAPGLAAAANAKLARELADDIRLHLRVGYPALKLTLYSNRPTARRTIWNWNLFSSLFGFDDPRYERRSCFSLSSGYS